MQLHITGLFTGSVQCVYFILVVGVASSYDMHVLKGVDIGLMLKC